MNNILSTLKSKKVLLCDGAMGTELQRRGLKVGDCPEEYNLSNSKMIQGIHKDYFDAGSDIVETNTFGANRLRLKFYDLKNRVEEINLAVVKNTFLPVAVSMTFELGKTGLKTPWGVDVQTAVTELTKAGTDIIGSNCGKGFDEMIQVIAEMRKLTTKPILAQSNAGIPELAGGNLYYKESPEIIASKVQELLTSGVNILGGCCGTTPLHIKKMREVLDLFLSNII